MNTAIYRIIDVNLNRLREALRVVEEYCRFHQNHPLWTTQLKEIRHKLVDFESHLSLQTLLSARDVLNDVGTSISGTHEFRRDTVLEVLRANFNRMKEACRVLEEYTKLVSIPASKTLEEQRYRIYQLESELLSVLLRKSLDQKYLYALFTPSHCKEPYLDVAKKLIEGGVQVLQLREKNKEEHELFQIAETLKLLLHNSEVLYLINDRPDIAYLVEADGVHLGQTDLPFKTVRQKFPQFLIGVSTHCREEALKASQEQADYIGVGPLFPSKTKSFEVFAGLPYLAEARRCFSGPQFALGGINPQNIEQVIEAGAQCIALSSALLDADNIVATTRFFRNRLDQSAKNQSTLL